MSQEKPAKMTFISRKSKPGCELYIQKCAKETGSWNRFDYTSQQVDDFISRVCKDKDTQKEIWVFIKDLNNILIF